MDSEKRVSFSLPDELMENILLRLPVKSLARFSSVSRHWYTLFRSERFVRSHFSLSNINLKKDVYLGLLKNQGLFFLYNLKFSRSLEVNSVAKFSSEFKFLDCCKGLVLFELRTSDAKNLVLYNPSSNLMVNIGPPSLKCHAFLLGYDSLTWEVVGFHNPQQKWNSSDMKVVCYGVKEMVWTESDLLPITESQEPFYLPHWHNRVFCANACFWLYPNAHVTGTRHSHVVCFNFESKDFGFIDLPERKKKEEEELFGRMLCNIDEEIGLLLLGDSMLKLYVLKEGRWLETWSTPLALQSSVFVRDAHFSCTAVLHSHLDNRRCFFITTTKSVICLYEDTREVAKVIDRPCLLDLFVESFCLDDNWREL